MRVSVSTDDYTMSHRLKIEGKIVIVIDIECKALIKFSQVFFNGKVSQIARLIL